MARPAKWRCVECHPGTRVFGPAGVPVREVARVSISFDELEALRLLHLQGATQQEAAHRLGVSRSTVSRMAGRAHRAVTEALVLGKAICIEGGPVTVVRIETTAPGRSDDPAIDPGALAEAPAGSAGGASQQPRNQTTEGEIVTIGVPYLNGNVNAHFGSTQAFLIAETADGKVERQSLFELQGMQHNHSGIAGFLKDQGVEVILAGGMGAPMQQALKQAGFSVYCGVTGPALEAIDAFLKGEIEQSESTCGHHHGEH